MSADGTRIALVTAPDRTVAERIARALVEERLIACANILGGVTSVYRWDDAVQQDEEVLLILKTVTSGLETLTTRVVELHPYDVPEVVVLPVVSGHAPYLAWVADSVGG